MKNRISIFSTIVLFSCCLLSFLSCSRKNNASEISGYHLVWEDEFETEGNLDPKDWNFENGFVRNNELQWYQPQNAFCEDGKLVIEARRETVDNPKYLKASTSWKENREVAEYTSASVTTRGLHSWKYGIFLIRAKIKTAPGLWPAIWTLGIENSWPHNGEIDIMEYYQDQLLANFAWGDTAVYQPVWKSRKKPLSKFPKNWQNSFHTWKMDWSADSIKLYVDDILLNEIALKNTVNRDGSDFNPFHQPHYLLLNLAIGGTQGGDPEQTQFPSRYLIDFVRVYQKD